MSGILGGIAGNLAGGNIGRAVVSLVLDTTGYNSQLEKTQAETVAATDSAGAATSKFSGVATAAYAVAGVAALDFAKSSVESAIEHQNVLAALTAQVGDNTQAFEDQATALQNVSGFQDEAILGADTILSRYKLTQQQVQAAIPAVLDLARAQGITATDAATQFGKAVLGNTRALKALGISSDQFVVTGNRAADAAVLVGLLNKQIGGQAAAYAQTFAGKLEILSARFDDFKESVGGFLLEELTKLADDINIVSQGVDKLAGSIPGLSDHMGILKDVLAPVTILFDYSSKALSTVGGWLGITADSTDGLTQAVGGLNPQLIGMTQASYDAAAASAHLSGAQKDLKAAVQSAGEGILSLTTTVKDTFNISEKELQHGFSQMLAASVRFKRDMAILGNLDIGLSPSLQTKFETFMVSQGPGYVDRFVRSTAAQQDRMVAKWEASIGAMNRATAGIQPVNIQVNSAALDLAAARADRLQQALSRIA